MKKTLHFFVLAITYLVIVSCSNENEWNIDNKELYRIQVEGKIGFINEKGKLVIDPQFDDAHPFFSDSVCFAKIGERKGLINTRGELVAELDSTIATVNDFMNLAKAINNETLVTNDFYNYEIKLDSIKEVDDRYELNVNLIFMGGQEFNLSVKMYKAKNAEGRLIEFKSSLYNVTYSDTNAE